MTKSTDRQITIAHTPTSTLLGLLLTIFSWMLTILLWVGKIITDGQWPGHLKLSVCSAVSAVATAFLATYGRHAWRKNRPPPGTELSITGVQALLVVVLVLAVGSFGTWLVWGPPFVAPWNGR